MSGPSLRLLVPGALDQRTGGYLYDTRVTEGLRRLDWTIIVHELDGRFPGPDRRAAEELDRTLAGVPDGARVVVDGLALGAHPGPVRTHGGRLRLLALVHHPLSDETGLGARRARRLEQLERKAYRAATGAVVTSRFTASRLEELGVSPDRVRVAVPGTEPAPRAEGPPPGEPPRLLCVGSVIPRKGQAVLVRALARLEDLDWTFVCAGSLERDPAYARRVREAVEDGGLQARIRFAGECDRSTLERLYRGSSLFVLPSRYEGYGMAFTEAMARGLPVVGTTGGAIPDTVPAEAGRFVPPGDDRALANALDGLLNERDAEAGRGDADAPAERRKRLGDAALRHARRLPDWSESARTFGAAVEDLAPEGATAR